MNKIMHLRSPQPQAPTAPYIKVVTYLSIAAIFMFNIRLYSNPIIFLSHAVLILCMFIMILNAKLYLDKTIAWLFWLFLLHGLFGIALGFSSFNVLAENLAKIAVYYVAYSSIIKLNNYNINRLVNIYLVLCIIAAYIGLLALLFYLIRFKPGYDFSWFLNTFRHIAGSGMFGLPRAQSIFSEPSHAVYTLGPAIYFSVGRFLGKHKSFISMHGAAAIIVFIFLTNSTTAFATIPFAILLNIRITIREVFVGAVVVLVVFYFVSPDFSLTIHKLSQLVEIIQNQGYIAGINGSSYETYIGGVISARTMMETYGFGGGIGSFEHASARHLDNIYTFGGKYRNLQTGGSLLARSLGEFGLFGIAMWVTVIYAVIKGWFRFSGRYRSIHLAMSVSFLPFLIRMGTYEFFGFAPFLLFFIINYRHAMLFVKASQTQSHDIANAQSM